MRRSPSLHARLLVAASIVLAAFLGLTGLALDGAFRDSVQTAVHDQLRIQLHGLVGGAVLGDDGSIAVPVDELPDPRLTQPESGLIALILDGTGESSWASTSMLGVVLPGVDSLEPNERRFATPEDSDGFFRQELGVGFESESGRLARKLTFVVGQDRASYDRQIQSFRKSLWFWLTGAALVLLLVQALILHWGLKPIRRAAEEVQRVEAGTLDELGSGYPRELRGLTTNINTFIQNEKRHLERYRNTLGDLAHSLKTPLSVIRGMVPGDSGVNEQIDRMNGIVDNQLRRAATRGQTTMMAPVDLESIARKVVDSVNKVYADSGSSCEVDIEPGLQFFGEEGDLYEVLGNLVDNAFKYGGGRVRVEASARSGPNLQRPGVRIVVSDNGPGVADSIREQILQRGVRGDQKLPGQGIGLAVVCDVVESYDGSVTITDSDLGGARVCVEI